MKTPEIDDLLNKSTKIASQLIEIRRLIHANPELAFNEHSTSELAANFLKDIGYKISPAIAGTGFYADLGEGDAVAIRADMDALAINENSHEKYRSRVPGVMHACGHDAHVAIVLGAAQLLADLKPKGKVRIIMQPAEEAADENGYRGSFHMIKAGALNDVKALLGLHVDATIASGRIGVINQPAADFRHGFEFLLASHSDQSIDFIELGSRMMADLGEEKRRGKFQENDLRLLEMRANNEQKQFSLSGSFVAEAAFLEGFKESLRQFFAGAVGKLDFSLDFESNEDMLVEHSKVISNMLDTTVAMLGQSNALPIKRRTWTVDFATYAAKVPAAFILVGAEIRGSRRTQHTASFDIDESSIPLASAVLAEAARRLLSEL